MEYYIKVRMHAFERLPNTVKEKKYFIIIVGSLKFNSKRNKNNKKTVLRM